MSGGNPLENELNTYRQIQKEMLYGKDVLRLLLCGVRQYSIESGPRQRTESVRKAGQGKAKRTSALCSDSDRYLSPNACKLSHQKVTMRPVPSGSRVSFAATPWM